MALSLPHPQMSVRSQLYGWAGIPVLKTKAHHSGIRNPVWLIPKLKFFAPDKDQEKY